CGRGLAVAAGAGPGLGRSGGAGPHPARDPGRLGVRSRAHRRGVRPPHPPGGPGVPAPLRPRGRRRRRPPTAPPLPGASPPAGPLPSPFGPPAPRRGRPVGPVGGRLPRPECLCLVQPPGQLGTGADRAGREGVVAPAGGGGGRDARSPSVDLAPHLRATPRGGGPRRERSRGDRSRPAARGGPPPRRRARRALVAAITSVVDRFRPLGVDLDLEPVWPGEGRRWVHLLAALRPLLERRGRLLMATRDLSRRPRIRPAWADDLPTGLLLQ